MPNKTDIKRKVAAIMFTDIAGYTKLTSEDEEKAFQLIKRKRELLLPLLEKYSGKLIKEIGDGTLTRYFNTKDAIDCANNFQARTDNELKVRAGIHSGEVIIENDDVFGEVVNIASRIESIAQPKSVLVSKETIDNLKNKEGLAFMPLGLQSLKGVGRLIEVYALEGQNLHTPKPEDYEKDRVNAHSGNEVPSIAIIPFENKGAEENAFYAYGISVDLINDCADAGLIKVVPMKEIEKIDYHSMNFKELSKTFNSRYISQGVLWKMDNIFQLSINLYDSKRDSVIWSDRWQENWNALTHIKDKLCDGLLKTLNVNSKESYKVGTLSTEAYKFYLEGVFTWEKREAENDILKSRELFNKAIKLDNDFLEARAMLAWTFMNVGDFDIAFDYYNSIKEDAERKYDKNNLARALHGLGEIYLFRKNNIEKGLSIFNKTLRLSQNIDNKRALGQSYVRLGVAYGMLSEFQKSINYLKKAEKIFKSLDLKDALLSAYNNLCTTFFKKGDYDNSLYYGKQKLKLAIKSGSKRDIASAQDTIAHSYSKKGEYTKAIEMKESALAFYTDLNNGRILERILHSLGNMYFDVGRLDESLKSFMKGLELARKIKLKDSISSGCNRIGAIYYEMGDYDKAVKFIEEAMKLDREIGRDLHKKVSMLELFACFKNLNKEFNLQKIKELEEGNFIENLDSRDTFLFYCVSGNESYLKKAYELLFENAENMEEVQSNEYLKFPNSKKIIEEYDKVFK